LGGERRKRLARRGRAGLFRAGQRAAKTRVVASAGKAGEPEWRARQRAEWRGTGFTGMALQSLPTGKLPIWPIKVSASLQRFHPAIF